MGITLLILAIIAIIVGISVKEYLQNKEVQEEIEKKQADLKVAEDFVQEEAIAAQQPVEIQPVVETPAPVAEQTPVVVKPKPKKRYYKPKGKKQQTKKQTK